jgi:drug/metabolite transporter (DMT)-like permease
VKTLVVYLMAGRRAQAALSVGTYTFIAYGTAALALLGLCLASATPLAPYPARDWLAFLGLAVLCTLGGHSLLNWALRHLSPTAVSASILGEPVGASFWAFILLGERPSAVQVFGGVAVLAGLALYGSAASPAARSGAGRQQAAGERQQGA